MSDPSLAELKGVLRITDTDDDTLIQLALDAAIDLVDGHCNRTFTPSVVASTRSFSPLNERVEVDDIYTTQDLVVTYGGTPIPLAVEGVSGGYSLLPLNTPANGEPITTLEISNWGNALAPFWAGRFPVYVTARWGYSLALPAAVKEARLLQASRLFSRKGSPYGVAGSPELGSELRLLAKVDPDVAVLLRRFVREEIL